MPGRPVPDEAAFAGGPLDVPALRWRRAVLRETLAAFAERGERYRALAAANLSRWCAAASEGVAAVDVVAGDWGEVALRMTKRFGRSFAVLNMANAHIPGGGYVEGMSAQEENMFRRTDCHFAIGDAQLAPGGQRYTAAMTDLIEGRDGRVLLDVAAPRVCIRGAEERSAQVGYEWLPDDEVFPFFELRAAARSYRRGGPFDRDDARQRIAAQLDTLVAAGVRHAVLGASGCGAFENPAAEIAQLYREELAARDGAFDCVVFAIYDPAPEVGNYAVFRRVFGTG